MERPVVRLGGARGVARTSEDLRLEIDSRDSRDAIRTEDREPVYYELRILTQNAESKTREQL